jgi:hypothetical protein
VSELRRRSRAPAHPSAAGGRFSPLRSAQPSNRRMHLSFSLDVIAAHPGRITGIAADRRQARGHGRHCCGCYHAWCDLKPGAGDAGFCRQRRRLPDAPERETGLIGSRRPLRRLALGAPEPGECYLMIEMKDHAEDLAEVEQAFERVAERHEPAGGLFAISPTPFATAPRSAFRSSPPDVLRPAAAQTSSIRHGGSIVTTLSLLAVPLSECQFFCSAPLCPD